MKIEQIKISDLTPYENNARRHQDIDVNAIVRSIEEFGFNDPVGVWGAQNIIVEGHGRVLAAKQLGMKDVPCIRLDNLTDEQRRAYALAHNKTAELSSWDMEILPLELESLPGIDMSQFGFDITGVYQELQGEEEQAVEDDDFDPDAEVESRAKLGDVWLLGDHRLMCGDSTKQESLNILMDGESADMVFTDPPWNVNYGGKENPHWKKRKILNDNKTTEGFKEFMDAAFSCMNASSKEGAMTYIVMSAQEWGNLMLTLTENGYHWSSTIIWNKDQFVLSRKDYHTKYEPIWYGWKEGTRLCPLKDRTQSDVWDYDRPKRSDEHPTMKPVPLVAHAVANSSKKGGGRVRYFRRIRHDAYCLRAAWKEMLHDGTRPTLCRRNNKQMGAADRKGGRACKWMRVGINTRQKSQPLKKLLKPQSQSICVRTTEKRCAA